MTTHDESMDRLHESDPVDAAQIIASWSDSDAKASLLKEIIAMPTETLTRDPDSKTPIASHPSDARSRWRRPTVLVAAAAFAALAIGIGSTLTGSPEPAYAISETPDGLIQVDVLAEFRDGDALARDLGDRGIDTEVENVPASPSMVGTVELGTTDGPAAGIQPGGADGTSGVFDWTIDPTVFTGTLSVRVFVEADDGEPFGAAQEVFEPGEKLGGLQCALGEPMRAADVARHLDRADLTAQWSIVTPTDDASVTNTTQVEEVPNGVVLSGYAIDNSTVRFDVLEDGQTLASGSAGYISDFPCTPEAAAAWR